MAAPIIDSIEPQSVALAPGGSADVVITAHDPDTRSGQATIPLSDGEGNVVDAIVFVGIADPLSFGEAVISEGLGVTVTRLSTTPTSATYRIQA